MPPGSRVGIKMKIRGMLEISEIEKCQFAIFHPEHYGKDGKCRCNDAEHRAKMIAEWGYKEEYFKTKIKEDKHEK